MTFIFTLLITMPSLALDSKQSLDEWLREEAEIAFNKMTANLSPTGTVRGVVVASPQTAEPNYFFHWIRDAALTMDVIVGRYLGAANGNEKLQIRKQLFDYVEFSRDNQVANALTGLGEPKFYVDGRPYDLSWGRPQNDGPALRTLTLIRFAQALWSEGERTYVQKYLYEARLPARTVIKSDLEYVAHHWREPSFDLWEEIKGDHFYTRVVQLAALRAGAKLARQLADAGAAEFYESQAGLIEESLEKFWDPLKGYVRATLGTGERSGLDAAVLLAVLHGSPIRDFSIADSRIMATVERLEKTFAALYSINDSNRFPGLGPAIGRYPEDVYSGESNLYRGNAWVLTTAALAEYYYKLARTLSLREQFSIDETNQRFVRAVSLRTVAAKFVFVRGSTEFANLIRDIDSRAESFMKRIRVHTAADGSMSEQMDRDSGYLCSARDLTWSYASFLTAYAVRAKKIAPKLH